MEDNQSMSDRHEREFSSALLWALTFAGAGLEVSFSLQVIYVNAIQLQTLGFTLPLVSPDITNLAVTGFLPLIWCGFWSARLKRVVSPLNVQILTMGAVALVLVNYMITATANPYGYFVPAFARIPLLLFIAVSVIIWGFSLIFYGAIGLMQTILVRWWNGLNLDKKPEVDSYLVDANTEKVLDTIDDNLGFVWNFKEKESDEEDVTILVRRNLRGPQWLVVGVGGDPNDNKKSIIAVVPYEARFYDLTTSKKADAFRDSFVRDFKQKLQENNPVITLSSLPDALENVVSDATLNYALRPVTSKSEIIWNIWREMTGYHKYVFGVLVSALAVTVLAVIAADELGVKAFPFDTVSIIAVSFFIAIVVDLGLAVRDEILRSRKKK
jgi:hypothetical protein